MNKQAPILRRMTRSLYLRIFVSFLFLLIVTLVAIFSFYIFFTGQYNFRRADEFFKARLYLNKRIVESALREYPDLPLVSNPLVSEEASYLAKLDRSKVWITGENGDVLIKTFPEQVPELVIRKIMKTHRSVEGSRFYRYRSHIDVYMREGVEGPDGTEYQLHILYITNMPEQHGVLFAFGLLGIGGIIALFAILMSRFISRPIKSLTVSVNQLGGGALSHRVSVKGPDEIEELGNAFNQMADKIESMIIGGKELNAQVSHELRSPLARIRIAVEILKDQAEVNGRAEPDEYLVSIQDEIEELDHLIGRILELSKLDLQVDSRISIISINEELTSLIEKNQPLIKQAGLRLSIGPSWDLLKIRSNRDNLLSVISSLLDNAVKYCPENGDITVQAFQAETGGKLSICNSVGPGTRLEAEKCFQPFYRGNNQLAVKGTGLGLSIAKKSIEKMGGTIRLNITPTTYEAVVEFSKYSVFNS